MAPACNTKTASSAGHRRLPLVVTLVAVAIAVAATSAPAAAADTSTGVTTAVGSGPRPADVTRRLPDLASGTSDEPIVALVGQDAYVSCVAKNLQNYTVIWKFSSDANAAVGAELREAPSTTTGPPPANATGDEETDEFEVVPPSGEFATIILTAGRQRVTSDERFSVIRSHDTWLLKIKDAQQADTGSYICETNSAPPARAIRVLSVVVAASEAGPEVEGKFWAPLAARNSRFLQTSA